MSSQISFSIPIPLSLIRVNANIDRKKGQCKIWIEDNGIGIEKEIWEDIFKMFYKGTNISEGPGLGLYIAQLALVKMGGSLRVIYSEPGKTVFELLIVDHNKLPFYEGMSLPSEGKWIGKSGIPDSKRV